MASSNLYAPTIDTSMPAFIANDSTGYKVYFSLSKFSSSVSAIKSVHVSVVKQSNGQSVINKTDNSDSGRYRSTGILILNTPPMPVEGVDNYYYVELLTEDIKMGDKNFGWEAGCIYKIQLRLSEVTYTGTPGQSVWLVANASKFSEWSTYCTVKAINQPIISVPMFDFISSNITSNIIEEEQPLSVSTLNFSGSYGFKDNEDASEKLYSYNLSLCDSEGQVLEDSGILYSNQYASNGTMQYDFGTLLEDGENYVLILTYTTINKFSKSYTFNFYISQGADSAEDIYAVTLDTVDGLGDKTFIENFKKLTSYEKENDEGRIGIKLYSPKNESYSKNICIRRADSKDNYTLWSDIKIIPFNHSYINDYGIIYDSTIESGVFYKYAIQIVEKNGNELVRSLMNPGEAVSITPSIREFNYSFLIGEDGRQLALRYDNTMSSYTYNYSDTKTDTIGGQYPIITRNGNMKYRTFPINGLISFNMDENNLFTSDQELYSNGNGKSYTNVIEQYTDRRRSEHLGLYDFKREHDFREKVLSFLQDGKPKLFKSASEGNIIVRLMSVAAQPNQGLSRLIYSFTSTATEIADATLANYLKYGFFTTGEAEEDFVLLTTKLGQLDIDLTVGENIIEAIWKKYDKSLYNTAGNRISIKKISNLSIEFTDNPMLVYTNSGELVYGNNIDYNGTLITIRSNFGRQYIFDEDINFTGVYKSNTFTGDSIKVLQGPYPIYDEDGMEIDTIHVVANFLYQTSEKEYEEKQIKKKTIKRNISQIFGSYLPSTDFYSEIYYKYYYEEDTKFRRLNQVTWACIEATPGAVFKILDSSDSESAPSSESCFDIGKTGILNLEGLGTIAGLSYLGMREENGVIDDTQPCDIIIDYLYYVTEGTYKEN